MQLNRKIYSTKIGEAELSLEFSELAGQANGAVIAKHGDTAVLAAVVMGKKDTGGDFFPLTVDYEERFYAAGKILGSRFVRREGKSTDEATLSARLIDRTIRPLFDPRLRREVQVTITVLSYDGEHDPDLIALLATSAALSTSDIPWNGPVAGAEFGDKKERGEEGFYRGFFAGPKNLVNMIELEGLEIAENKVRDFFAPAMQEINRLVEFQEKVVAEIGKPKQQVALPELAEELIQKTKEFILPKLPETAKNKTFDSLKKELEEVVEKEWPGKYSTLDIESVFEMETDAWVHEEALKYNRRVDGRAIDQVRDLGAEVGIFRRMHGSALFMRGATQVLAITTLGSPAQEQLIESMEGTEKKRFLLHYNFPKFSTGEAGRSRGPGRREIGHGALAHKALVNLIPSKDKFPYTIRVVAETLSSNGSSSMASTCSACLSLMDAGVPIPKPVGGIAIGLMTGANGEYKILTDIQGPEDHYGDMDFKVAGTRDGVTAVQMDVKVNGITEAMYKDALSAALKARETVISTMEKALSAPRKELSPYAPKITIIKINPEQIGLVIGSGGKTINGIIERAGGDTLIDIDEDGSVFISGTDQKGVAFAVAEVEALTKEYKVGEVVTGPIIKTLDFGAILDLGGGKDGMIHVSELKEGFVEKVTDIIKVGEVVTAKVVRVDSDGRIGLSLKAMKGKE